MKKYLAFYENEWPADIEELTAVENKPFVGYLKGEEVKFTVVPKIIEWKDEFRIISLEDDNEVIFDSTNLIGLHKEQMRYSIDSKNYLEIPDSIILNKDQSLALKCVDGLMDYNYNGSEIPLFKTTKTINLSGKLHTAIYSNPDASCGEHCYRGMFTGVKVVSASNLILIEGSNPPSAAYAGMFNGCSYLTDAPVLSAKRIYTSSYQRMFLGCTSLNKITCLATQIDMSGTWKWVSGVSTSGTFIKSANMNNWSTGADGIPEGWTVVDYEE